MARRSILLLLAVHITSAWWITQTPASAAEFYSVVERNGTVVLCLAQGSILFSDRCAGEGRLTIVEPIKEGPVVWRSVTGTVSLENQYGQPGCPLSRAKWDPKAEKIISTGRKITKADRAALLQRLSQSKLPGAAEFIEDDITAFMLDLDNDGKQEIVFVASSLKRVAEAWERDQAPDSDIVPHPYATYAGVLPDRSDFPALFYNDHGNYEGGTDAIGSVTLKGVASLSPGTGEIALLIKAGSGFDGKQALIRYRNWTVQKIESIQFTCD
jgi:hypothetical protein